MNQRIRSLLVLAVGLTACTPSPPRIVTVPGMAVPPASPRARAVGLLGEYDAPAGMRIVLEDAGALYIADTNRHRAALQERDGDDYGISPSVAGGLLGVTDSIAKFVRDASGRATAI